MQKMERILGIDLGLLATGLVLWDADGTESDIITLGERLRGGKRLFEVGEKIWDRIDSWEPDLVVLEGYAYAGQKVVGTAELGGVVKCLLHHPANAAVIRHIIVPPGKLKKFATGNGNADKPTMAQAVRKRWGYDPEGQNEHLIDAYALAMFGACWAGIEGLKFTKEQREIVKKVELAE